jgi:outer membrane protein assembly factor BamD (BamD/ComL family)
MMQKFTVGLLFILSMFVISCGNNKDEAVKKITELEKKLLDPNGNPINEVSAYNLQVEYDDFAMKFAEEPEAPEYLFKAANISINLGWGESAVKILNKFLEKFPEHTRAPEAMFFLGFVYDNQINDDAKAGDYYQQFLKKYPSHTFAKDAEASIKNLGKTDEELMREFEKMNGDTTAVKDTAAKAA